MSMQQVNLHQPVVQTPMMLTAKSAAGAMLTIIVALLGMWGYAWWQLRGMRHEADLARVQGEARRKLEAVRMADLDALSPEDLDRTIAVLDAAVKVKLRAVQTLGDEAARSADFSARLAALSSRHVDGVWLEQLTLGASRDSMSLTGAALAPDLVPRYLQSLAADPALSGGEIDNFVIDRPAGEPRRGVAHLRFRVATGALQTPSTLAAQPPDENPSTQPAEG
ncbi:MAG: hypothetical protein U1F39_00180 [Steroidobacteraceae bacterium]